MTQANSYSDFSDADLKASMRRAMRFTAIFAVIGFVVLLVAARWQTAALFIAGAVVSATGLYEWNQLIAVINAKMDNQRPPRATGFTLTMFFLRLGIAGVIIYASLRYFNGSLWALIAGL